MPGTTPYAKQKLWTPEETEKLVILWNRGKSASDIGAIFGSTKNRIIGKIDQLRGKGIELRVSAPKSDQPTLARRSRMGITKPAEGPSTGYAVTKRAVMDQPRINAITDYGQRKLSALEAEMTGSGVTISEIKKSGCRRPTGGRGEAMLFCGELTTRKSYCACHAERVYA